MENNEKIVYYRVWCPRCKHRTLSEAQEPCHECMNNPVNINSHKPVNFVPRFYTERPGGKMKERER